MNREKHFWMYDILFLLVLVLAGYLRLTGADWGKLQHQHPDENTFSSVLGSLRAQKCLDELIPVDACPVEQRRWLSIGDYFDSETSPLNPYNRGFGSYVYGDLPMTLVRLAADMTGPVDLRLFGRQASAFADLFAIVFLYFLVARLYDRRMALLAALFSSLTVMQIQQSHFFTVDLFVNTFAMLAAYFAVEIMMQKEQRLATRDWSNLKSLFSNPLFLYSLGFGVAYGMALASKVNIYPLAVLLPGAFAVRYLTVDCRPQTTAEEEPSAVGGQWSNYWTLIITCLVTGGLAALISFRIFQPYAFDGLMPDERWVADITQQRAQATGEADMPWNLQWVRRSHLYSFTNLTLYGLGLPLGILAWIGFLYMGWRILKGEWQHALLWGWTAAYFIWQSLQFNPTMRYQLPIYPLLAMMAAWFVFELAGDALSLSKGSNIQTFKRFNLPKILASVIGITVLALTAAWAFAFQSIYLREEPRIAATRWIYQNVPGPINVQIKTADGDIYNQPLPFPTGVLIDAGVPYNLSFTPRTDGQIVGFYFPHVADQTSASAVDLNLILSEQPLPTPNEFLAQASVTFMPQPTTDLRGGPVTVELNEPIPVTEGQPIWLNVNTTSGFFTLSGSSITNETDFDYTLPFRLDGYDAFGGLYRGDLNLQVYWDDNADKLNRYVSTLDQTDYIFIPTNHQYAQITRVPERYPLTAYYYRELMGCPPELDTIRCYHEANPGEYKGRLGFDLVAVFETFPKLGEFEINDQYAEEAFTFYDHPKVFIFKKRADFSAAQVQVSLGIVDLTKVVRLLPTQFSDFSTLQLPPARLATQRAGGTWSDLFNYNWIHNRYPVIGLVIWYLFIIILGVITYPIIRLAMPGLADKGYPLSRALGLVLFGYLVWVTGSAGVPVTRLTIAIIFGLLVLIGVFAGYRQRDELIAEWKSKRKYFLMVEGLFLAFFLIDLFIRIGNPDLWHPFKGGERPMDFSYFNAILKSTTFPPYDPWFAGGYINYYYYGFVLVGMPVKLLGIVPTIAYNFILPTLFAMVGACAFSIGWNLLAEGRLQTDDDGQWSAVSSPFIAGLSVSILTILLGNLGTIKMLYNKLQILGSLGTFAWDSTFTQRLTWAYEGLKLTFNGVSLPIGPGDWYWDPSRVVPPGPGNAITEFPLFTFLYSDLHAHMMVMPVALLALAWALSVLKTGALWQSQAHPERETKGPESDRRASIVIGMLVGGLVIGAVYPANLSDAYTYLLIGISALAYAIWQYARGDTIKRVAWMIGAAIGLYMLSTYMYYPYRAWYVQAYSALDPWKGPFTPLASYFTHWGVFLFIVVSWLTWETREWMANTPLSALKKLKPYQMLIEGALIALVVALLAIQFFVGTSVQWVALPIAAWAGVLLLNPRMTDSKRLVLFLIGTALFITVLVDVVVVRGDIGRQNTIFKFYLQAWLMLAVGSGAMLAWLLSAFFRWLSGWRAFWQTAMVMLIAGAALFTITGTAGKIKDRWILEAPRVLDSMTYMKYANYDDFGQRLDLSEDYRAIRWMQDHVQGSPVIVEANCPEYRWCTRFTIYTGLPGVVGWNFHQRQQRAFTSLWVEQRVAEIGNFYNSIDVEYTRNFLKTYGVKYIIVGQLERAAYIPEGIAKFEQYDGVYWKAVYGDGQTTIYEVMP
jgi:YYY domain-containing protein